MGAHFLHPSHFIPIHTLKLNHLSSRSALTFVCGIYVYTVTWILLGENSDNELLPSAWKQFMVSAFSQFFMR